MLRKCVMPRASVLRFIQKSLLVDSMNHVNIITNVHASKIDEKYNTVRMPTEMR